MEAVACSEGVSVAAQRALTEEAALVFVPEHRSEEAVDRWRRSFWGEVCLGARVLPPLSMAGGLLEAPFL